MQEVTSETQDYIIDCAPLQLAVKVGIVGIIIQFISTLILEVVYFNFFDTPEMSITLFNYQVSLVKFLSISWVLFVSMGYLGIFLMKQNRLAPLFPSLALISTAGYWIYRWYLWEFVPGSGSLLATSEVILANIVVAITGLALLAIRKETVNTKLLYTLVIVLLTNVFLIGLFGLLGRTTPIYGGFDYLIADLPRLAIKFVISCLVIAFFVVESRAGCDKVA